MKYAKPDSSPATPSQRLASHYLGQDVRAWINERRAEGVAWRWIARELAEATDGTVDVTHESVRSWAKAGDAA